MNKYCYKQFNDKFGEFLHNLNITFRGDNELEVFNKKVDLVKPEKLIKRYIKVMKPYHTKLENKDESMFDKDIYFLPKVNISRLWKKNISGKTKENIWQYLQILYILGDVIVNEADNTDMLNKILPSTQENKNNSTEHANLNINNIIQNLDIDSKLSNINKDDIKEASENIKKMFSNDNKSNDLMCDLVNDITSELSEIDSKNGLTGILKIAENVADKFKPKIESGEFDINELLGSAQNVMKQMCQNMPQTNNSEPNPLNMLNSLMANLNTNPNLNK